MKNKEEEDLEEALKIDFLYYIKTSTFLNKLQHSEEWVKTLLKRKLKTLPEDLNLLTDEEKAVVDIFLYVPDTTGDSNYNWVTCHDRRFRVLKELNLPTRENKNERIKSND